MSILHTGTAYVDERSEDCLLYHYPDTDRPTTRDAAEVAGKKAARKPRDLQSLIFVVLPSSASSSLGEYGSDGSTTGTTSRSFSSPASAMLGSQEGGCSR
jgi:hypothetical protein